MTTQPPSPPLRIAVIGAGAVGVLFGARLTRAGHDVHFVVRAATLANAALARTWQRYDSLPPESMKSMQRDLIAGRPSQFEWQTGTVVRLGRLHQVPTPVHALLYAALKPIAAMSAASGH